MTTLPSGDAPKHADLIGQVNELAALSGMFETVLGGSGSACLVSGDAGVGKTLLLKTFLERAQRLECYVLFGRAHNYDQGIAYASLRDQLMSLTAGELAVEVATELEGLGRGA